MNSLWFERFACFALSGNGCCLFSAFVCLCGCCCFLDFPEFHQTLLTSMRVGHTGRDTARVSERAHCQLSSLSSYLACLLLWPLLFRPVCGFTTLKTRSVDEANAVPAWQLSYPKATSSNWPTMMLSKSYRASMPCLINLCHLSVWETLWQSSWKTCSILPF